MIKFGFLIFISIIGSVSASSNSNKCASFKHKVLEPDLGLGKMNCIDTGEYSRNGCRMLREHGNIVCKLTPFDKPQNGKCYHMRCDWKEQDNYKLSWDIKPPYDTVQVTMTPELDLSPGWGLFLVVIFLFLWIPFACANPDLACIICFSSCNDRGIRHGRSSKFG